MKTLLLPYLLLLLLLFSYCNTVSYKEIPADFVYTIKQHGDSVYYSTNRGEVFRFQMDNETDAERIGFKKNYPIRSLLFSDSGTLFACSYRSGLYVFSSDTLNTFPGWYHPSWSMKTDPEGRIWLASKNGIYRQHCDTFEMVTDLREAFDLDFYYGELVVAHYKGLSFYDMENGKLKKTICNDTICWMCTVAGSRLICGGTECCIVVESNQRRDVKLGPAGNMPWSCTVDSTGIIVLGTEKGLYKISKDSKKAQCIGFYKKCIKSVLFDNKNRLWVGTYF